MSKTNISFQQYVQKNARARGAEATAELAKLKKKFPEYKDAKQYAKNFPVTFKRYQGYLARGPQTKKAA